MDCEDVFALICACLAMLALAGFIWLIVLLQHQGVIS